MNDKVSFFLPFLLLIIALLVLGWLAKMPQTKALQTKKSPELGPIIPYSRHFLNTLTPSQMTRLSRSKLVFICCTSNSFYQFWQYRLLIFSIMETYRRVGLPEPTILALVSEDDEHLDFSLPEEWGQRLIVLQTPRYYHQLPKLHGNPYKLYCRPAALHYFYREYGYLLPRDGWSFWVETDMILNYPVEPQQYLLEHEKNVDLISHPFDTDKSLNPSLTKHVMMPVLIKNKCCLETPVCQLYDELTFQKYLQYHDYYNEMEGLVQGVDLSQIPFTTKSYLGVNRFSDTATAEERRRAIMVHYCQDISKDGHKIWFKQDYTPDTMSKIWKRPALPEETDDYSAKQVLTWLHQYIDSQEQRYS